MGFINIEIKANCRDPQKIAHILEAEKADFRGMDHQVDTYFNVKHGRLKLREGNIEHSLIHYERENTSGPKTSKVILYKPKPDKNLKEILTKSLGVLTVVDKKRNIYFIENVKFHIDDVEGLGSFVEIEAIDSDGAIGTKMLQNQCNKYLKLFGIMEEDLIAVSYSDMLLEKNKK
ncbi:MAG: class IV adenylate cyclase [Bacteroidales bacterium]|nr:class IV adenylate cyclase [Bacteroidales bacterium]